MRKTWFLPLTLALLFSCGEAASSSEAFSSDQGSAALSSESTALSSESTAASTDATYDFYCVNDFHGSIVEQMNGRYFEAGIAKYFGKLKELKAKDPDHTFILSAGDMFQGSLESNDNYGHLVIDAMNDVGFDAMTVGNHEFDYGQQRLLDNIDLMEFPVLGGNIRRYENGPTLTPWSDSIGTSAIIERGGNRIGIVGMIGYGQTSSITSRIVQDIYFESPARLATAEAKRLRQEEDCDIVVYVIHDDMASCQTYAADKQYFDGVFCGHKHTKNNRLIGNVPFIQSYCNGEAISHFQLTIKDGKTTCTSYGLIDSQPSWTEDEKVAEIRDSYIKDPDFTAKAGAIAGTIEGTLSAKEGVSNLISKAIYDKYKTLYPELRCGMQNGLRAPLNGEVTYRDIYKAAPFTNNVTIASVLGSEILSEGEANSIYCGEDNRFSPNEHYLIACVDYVLYHQNDKKEFNYFPSLNDNPDAIVADYEDYPFDLAFAYIHDNENGDVNASDYLNSCPGFSAVQA